MEQTTPPPAPETPPTAAPAAKTDGKAIAALILGICSFPPIVGPICAILAVVFGAMSMKKIAASGGMLTGKPLAIIGLVLGILGFVVGLIFTISMFIAIAAAAVEGMEGALLLAVPLA